MNIGYQPVAGINPQLQRSALPELEEEFPINILTILTDAVQRSASDVFIIAGRPITYKIMGSLIVLDDTRLDPGQTEAFVQEIYALTDSRKLDDALERGDDDFSIAVPGLSRFRVNIYRQRGSLAAVVRIITFELPDPETIHIPQGVMDLADGSRGLILVTGSAGSGKSTTLACLIDRINRTRSSHIITLEDPLEYLHRHQMSIVSQREIATDSESYAKALRAALRQSPDVILLGEMRSHDTINLAMTAAESGHLVFSTLHTIGAVGTIGKIIDAFPSSQQNQVRTQLSMVLQAVVSQQLVPTLDGTMIPAFEIMLADSTVRSLIRESRIEEIDRVILSSAPQGMLAMDKSLLTLYQQGIIADKTAIAYSTNPEFVEQGIQQ